MRAPLTRTLGVCDQPQEIRTLINPAAPGKTFEVFWAELSAILRPGSRVGKFYGSAFAISVITEVSVTIDSPDVGGVVEIPREAFRIIYADWRNYRYENEKPLHTNSQETLHVISLIEHVVQTWVRREERTKLIESACTGELRDGVFWVVHYNKHGRIWGPSPVGEPVSLKEVFSAQSAALLSELELAATKLFNASTTNIERLAAEHPDFGEAVYRSVVARIRFADIW